MNGEINLNCDGSSTEEPLTSTWLNVQNNHKKNQLENS